MASPRPVGPSRSRPVSTASLNPPDISQITEPIPIHSQSTPTKSTTRHSPPALTQSNASLSPSAPRAAGTRSPSSIPSSPTSINSSSSAIFERDIESLALAPPHLPPNPHRTPRAKATEQLEQSVPSVLSSAVSALEDTSAEGITIIAPIPASTSAVTSRSGSPTTSTSPLPVPVHLPTKKPSLPPGSLSAPGVTSSPSDHAVHPARTPPTDPSPSPTPSANTGNNRLSFISYTDLLSSAPLSAVPLSAIVSPTSTEPPPHIPAVVGVAAPGGSGVTGPQEPEWDRQGLGQGLEERLERLLAAEGRA